VPENNAQLKTYELGYSGGESELLGAATNSTNFANAPASLGHFVHFVVFKSGSEERGRTAFLPELKVRN
jgi:hypothetical protein